MCSDRPWGKGNNPKTAIWECMRRRQNEGRKARSGADLHFEYDHTIGHKIMITVSADGFLKRVCRFKQAFLFSQNSPAIEALWLLAHNAASAGAYRRLIEVPRFFEPSSFIETRITLSG
jgi:hypothetical protein